EADHRTSGRDAFQEVGDLEVGQAAEGRDVDSGSDPGVEGARIQADVVARRSRDLPHDLPNSELVKLLGSHQKGPERPSGVDLAAVRATPAAQADLHHRG